MSAFGQGLHHLLAQAYDMGASDVHVEPLQGGGLQVRSRIDGLLRVVAQVDDPAQARRFAEVVKRDTGCDTGRLGVPQDVRFSLEDPPCDFRVALVPGLEGEKFVLRLLPREVTFDLDRYRMPDDAKTDLREALAKRDGIIVVSGPTGSGKTTLLYNALHSLNAEAQAIYTLEDPVEYRLPGVSQCQVDRDRGVGFAGLLRSLMRADPDVILVGEIRDAETAEAAFHAAKTGHLVLTTVHANNTAQIKARLQDLGVSATAYDTTVKYASAQRLVPTICPDCRVEDPEGKALLARAGWTAPHAFRGAGCAACAGAGTRGRTLLMGWQTQVAAPEGGVSLEGRWTLLGSALRAVDAGVVRAVDAAGL